MRTTGTARYRPVVREDGSVRQRSADLVEANTYPDTVHEQPDQVEHDPERPRHELRRQTREKHGHRHEQARAQETCPQTVLGDPDAAAPLPPGDDHLIREMTCERRTNCRGKGPFVSRSRETGN